MHILHINQSDRGGGAGIAAYRLHQGLLRQGLDSRLLLGTAIENSDRIAIVPRKPRLEKQLYRFTWQLGLNYLHLLGSFEIPHHPFYQQADILHFHNLHTGYFNYLALPKLTQDKPAVMTLHDLWSFTGHCAYNYNYHCDRWKMGCGNCPHPEIYPAIGRDSTHLEWKLKDWVYRRSRLEIISPSRWLTQQAQQSILSRFPIHWIPHGIDTNAYQPLDSQQCRSLLGIPEGTTVLMCGANSLKDIHKGGKLLVEALNQLPKSLQKETRLLILGEGGETITQAVDIQTINLGYVSSDRLKSLAYSAADLFLFPTRADIFGLVLQESMACGTPLVSFRVGGVPDLVRPGVTGYLAEADNVQDFTQGIVSLVEDPDKRQRLSQNCREIVLQEYTLEHQTQRYLEVYQTMLNS